MLKNNTDFTHSAAKQNIVNTFWQLYKSKGLSNVTVTNICKITGYNLSTFYANFEDIHDVLHTLECSLISPLEFQTLILNNLISSTPDEAIISSIITLFERNNDYFPVLLGPNGDPGFRRKILNSLLPTVTKTLASTNNKKTFLPYILEYQNAAVFSVISLWYENGKTISRNDLIALLISLTTNGVKQELLSTK